MLLKVRHNLCLTQNLCYTKYAPEAQKVSQLNISEVQFNRQSILTKAVSKKHPQGSFSWCLSIPSLQLFRAYQLSLLQFLRAYPPPFCSFSEPINLPCIQVPIQQHTPIHRLAARHFSPIKVGIISKVLVGFHLKIEKGPRFSFFKKDPVERERFLLSANTFLVVRHPFERLLSAFMESFNHILFSLSLTSPR